MHSVSGSCLLKKFFAISFSVFLFPLSLPHSIFEAALLILYIPATVWCGNINHIFVHSSLSDSFLFDLAPVSLIFTCEKWEVYRQRYNNNRNNNQNHVPVGHFKRIVFENVLLHMDHVCVFFIVRIMKVKWIKGNKTKVELAKKTTQIGNDISALSPFCSICKVAMVARRAKHSIKKTRKPACFLRNVFCIKII